MKEESPKEKSIKEFVTNPSISAVIYQAQTLIDELKHINDEEFPIQACRIRNVCLCFAVFIQDKLGKLNNEQSADADERFLRLSKLSEALQYLYSFIRFLRASSPRQSPPAIQVALTQLTDAFFQSDQGDPICLIRPQWKYNLTYIPFTFYLQEIVPPSVLAPEDGLNVNNPNELIPALWKKWTSRLTEDELKHFGITGEWSTTFSKDELKRRGIDDKENPPRQLAILSFAGLDTNDTLLYPLLAHELGHFIDFSHDPPLHRQLLSTISDITDNQIISLLIKASKEPHPDNIKAIRNELNEQVSVCFRELLADVLALRMMGFAFFVAHSELLKTIAAWPQQMVTPGGYPGIKFRLRVVFEHLYRDDSLDKNLKLLPESSEHKDKINCLNVYLSEWKERLRISVEDNFKLPEDADSSRKIQYMISEMAEKIVMGELDKLFEIAKTTIRDEKCAQLSNRFYERIDRLNNDLPPFFPVEVVREVNEEGNCFAEIMSASWAYQLLYGEGREILKKTDVEKYNEYSKTCRLVLKAIELVPSYKIREKNTNKTNDINILSSPSHDWIEKEGVLSGPYIWHRIQTLPIGHKSHLDITPFYPNAINGASLDVHLGNWFVVARRVKLNAIQIERDAELLRTIGREEVFVPSGKSFLIHPSDLVIGATMEFIALPDDLMAFVEGRSSLGRIGLIVATASQIAPSFHGVIVLELANAGTVPLEVRPGDPIAQLVFQTMTEPVPENYRYRKNYYCQIKP